jgi:hypothetical protein
MSYAAYHAEFEATLTALRASLSAASEVDGDAGERRVVLQKCEADVASLESLVRQMAVEQRANPGSGELKRAIGAAKEQVRAARHEVAACKEASDRAELFQARSGGAGLLGAGTAAPLLQMSEQARGDRSRFEAATARMDRSTQALTESRRTIAETEEVAASIAENLASQRAVIIGAHDRVTATGGLIGSASQVLRRMRNNETRRKAILVALIVFLLVSIALIFTWALRPAAAPAPAPAPTLAPTALILP